MGTTLLERGVSGASNKVRRMEGTSIKTKVTEVYNNYIKTREEYFNIGVKIKDLEQSKIYSQEYIMDKVNELKNEQKEWLYNIAKLYNSQMLDIVSSEKDRVLGVLEPQKSKEYQVQISNALKFLELAGDKLTDNQAFNILKPFRADYETMCLFQSVVESMTQQGLYAERFGKTFEKTNTFIELVNCFGEAENIAKDLFKNSPNSLETSISIGMFMERINAIETLIFKLDEDLLFDKEEDERG